jgi:hypothetical protein
MARKKKRKTKKKRVGGRVWVSGHYRKVRRSRKKR